MKLSEFEKLIKQPESWECVPDDWCAVNDDGEVYYFKHEPRKLTQKTKKWNDFLVEAIKEYHLTKGEGITDFEGKDWTTCIYQRPVDYNHWVGSLVYVTCDIEDTIGILNNYDIPYHKDNPFKIRGSNKWFNTCRQLTKQEIIDRFVSIAPKGEI